MSNFEQSENAKKFLASDPYVLAKIGGRKYYEHPTMGDEAPPYIIYKGKLFSTDDYDLPEDLEAHRELMIDMEEKYIRKFG